MYNIEELVNILNKRVSLENFNDIEDKRRSNVWTVRLVREYIYKHNIKGIKKGNINEIKNILILKSATANSYKAVSNTSSSALNAIYRGRDEDGFRNEKGSLKSILDKTVSVISDVENETYSNAKQKLLVLNEIESKTIIINDKIQINYSVGNETLIYELKKWLNNIGE
jgi:hypothetical protein